MYSQIQDTTERTFGLSKAGGALLFSLVNTRLRLLHVLVQSGEQRVTDMAELLSMTPQAVSNQLQHMADLGIVRPRRDGTQIYYTIVDPCAVILLDRGLCLVEDRGKWS